MGKPSLNLILAFLILGILIYVFRYSLGNSFAYAIVSMGVFFFWRLLGLKGAFSSLKTLLTIVFLLGSLMIFTPWVYPVSRSNAKTGLVKNGDLNPGEIGRLKNSREVAVVLQLQKKPTKEERYYKEGELIYTLNGLRYGTLKETLAPELLPKTLNILNSRLKGRELNQDIESLRHWFTETLTYSLDSGPYRSHTPLDEFLFEGRRGFCEHFAASACTILTLKGYRSRISYGYAGGTWNPFLNTLTFENADAHAWVEVFEDTSQSWKIIDPTIWVAPSLSVGRDLDWNFLGIVLVGILIGLSGFLGFFIPHREGGIDALVLKVNTLEKKHGLDPKGITLSQRILRLAEYEPQSKAPMFSALKLYLKSYASTTESSKLDREIWNLLKEW